MNLRPLVVVFGLGGLVLTAMSLGHTQAFAPGCSAPEFRQFDFWVGDWNVSFGGPQTARNTVTRIYGGCAIKEEYTEPGMAGMSISTYYQLERKWHQVWVNDRGAFLRLAGEFKDGKMVLLGENVRPATSQTKVFTRVTWSLAGGDGDRVRQLAESSTDGGTTWRVDYEALYTRRRS